MISIDPLSQSDVAETAAMHREHLHLGLFPKLGRRFLQSYHETFIDSPHAVALVAREDDRIVGVLMGTTSNAGHYRWVVRNRGWRLAAAGILALSKRPALAVQFATTRGMRYGRAIMRRIAPASSAGRADAPAAPKLSVLSHIVTDTGLRRRGIGRKLVAGFADAARLSGAEKLVLVTEEGGLGAPFFERIGARLMTQRRGQDGVTVREYAMMLGDKAAYERVVEDRNGRSFVRAVQPRPGATPGYGAVPTHRPS